MAQGEFTKDEAKETAKAVEQMYEGLPKTRRGRFLGHLNDILPFIDAAKRAAPARAVKKRRKILRGWPRRG